MQVHFCTIWGRNIEQKFMSFCVQSGNTNACAYRKFRVALRNSKQITAALNVGSSEQVNRSSFYMQYGKESHFD